MSYKPLFTKKTSSNIDEYDPSKACGLSAEEIMRKSSQSRAKPEKRVLEECINVDEGSGCTSKKEDMIVDECSSDDESMMIFIVVRVNEICYYLLTLLKFQLNACYSLPHVILNQFFFCNHFM